jgi:hypothetical protein
MAKYQQNDFTHIILILVNQISNKHFRIFLVMDGGGEFVFDFLRQLLVHSVQRLKKGDHVWSANIIWSSHRIELRYIGSAGSDGPQMLEFVNGSEKRELRLAHDADWIVGKRTRNDVRGGSAEQGDGSSACPVILNAARVKPNKSSRLVKISRNVFLTYLAQALQEMSM